MNTCVKVHEYCPKVSLYCAWIFQRIRVHLIVHEYSPSSTPFWHKYNMNFICNAFLLETLPCSKQLSFQVIPELSGWVWVLKAEVPGIQPKQIPSWHVWGRGGKEGRGRGRGRLKGKNGRGRVRWYRYINSKLNWNIQSRSGSVFSVFVVDKAEKTVLQI